MDIRLTQLRKRFVTGGRAQLVLDGLDAAFAAGDFIALLGRSGSGKSTLLNLIGGLDQPDAGHIEIGGRDLAALDERERTLFRRQHIGFVFQFFNLLPTLTVAENVQLPLALNHARQDVAARVEAALAEVGLAGYGERFPEELSGGEQQRVAIARALIHEPAVVLADEPTGNLDLDTARQVVELLDEVCTRRQATLIMATHSREVVGYATAQYALRDGRLQATGE